MSEVHPRVAGWIEETFVDFQYQHVERGDPLFTLYSPELVATQEEYLLALRGLETLGTSSFPSARLGAEDLVRAARRRLELWDITPDQIERIEETREPVRAMTIHSPVTGHVMVRNAFAGQRVGPETMLYQIADHSVVWVRGDVYENDMAWVEAGQRSVMRVPALPGREFDGQLTFIDPHVDARTRTLSVRLEFDNPDLVLKPGMYAEVELSTSMGRRLLVPESAVLPTGLRNVVFVDRGEGRMEIRNVELGTRIGDRYEVLSGLAEGERVVTSGNFLIDAESRLQAAEPVWQGETAP
jgi:Cu(I)/Ag(I) efflux system membrane fusion protein